MVKAPRDRGAPRRGPKHSRDDAASAASWPRPGSPSGTSCHLHKHSSSPRSSIPRDSHHHETLLAARPRFFPH